MDTPNYCPPKHVVIVMDALKEFSDEPLEWVLDNITLKSCCTITLLGVLPCVNTILPNKSRKMGIWNMHLEDILATKKDSDQWKNDVKYKQYQQLAELCKQYQVFPPQISIVTGYPLNVTIVEKIASLNATLAIFDKHHDKKNIEYYAKKAPCDILVLRDDEEEVDIIKGQSHVTNDDDHGVDDDMDNDNDDDDDIYDDDDDDNNNI